MFEHVAPAFSPAHNDDAGTAVLIEAIRPGAALFWSPDLAPAYATAQRPQRVTHHAPSCHRLHLMTLGGRAGDAPSRETDARCTV